MKTVTIRDFRTRPKQARKALASEGEAVLTSNGRPVAIMLSVSDDSLDETVETVRRARALRDLRQLRRQAQSRRVDRMPMKQIDALIRKTRRERAHTTQK